jgi:hypothetical protein
MEAAVQQELVDDLEEWVENDSGCGGLLPQPQRSTLLCPLRDEHHRKLLDLHQIVGMTALRQYLARPG